MPLLSPRITHSMFEMGGWRAATDHLAGAAALVAVGLVVTFHGFDCGREFGEVERVLFVICFGLIGLQVATSLEAPDPPGPTECLLVMGFGLEVLLRLWGTSLLLPLLEHVTSDAWHLEVLIGQAALMLLAGITLARRATRSLTGGWLAVSPPLLFVLSYPVQVTLGACLLMLPEMTATGRELGPQEALFTSISACCVTGLTVVDTATTFSLKGKLVLLGLIQVGGLNIIAFATYFMLYLRRGDVSPPGLAYEHLAAPPAVDVGRLIKRTVLVSVAIEAVGAAVLLIQWAPHRSASAATQIFDALFHSVSAYNNAGFSTFSAGLLEPEVSGAFASHLTIAVLIVLGGLGVPALIAIGTGRLDTSARVAWRWAAGLTAAGMLGFMALEHPTLADRGTAGAWVTALFQSVTARTAGFNTIDFGLLGNRTVWLAIALMFVGASSGSTGGGVKTSTVAVLVSGLLALITGRQASIAGAHVTPGLVGKAVAIVLSSAATIAVATLLLCWAEPSFTRTQLLFESASSFGTVGLSMGVTRGLSPAGRWIVMATILIGRIGPLALYLSLCGRDISTKPTLLAVG